MTYIPILKAKQGELKALQEWDGSKYPRVFPLIEVTPWDRFDDWTAEELHSHDSEEIQSAIKRITRAWEGKTPHAYIDAAYAEPDLSDGQDWSQAEPVLTRVLKGLHAAGVRAAPVIRASVDSGYSRWIAGTIADLRIPGALIRVTAEDLDDSVVPLRQLVQRTASALGLDYSHVSVILDFGSVPDEGAMTMASRLARFVVPQLAEDPWRRIGIAAGAFPVNLSDVQPYEPSSLQRWDMLLWESLRSFELPNDHALHFADYAVTHPMLPVGIPFAAPPQLRYALRREWVVTKGKRQDRRGHTQFYEICATMLTRLGIGASSPDRSWGDEYIHKAASSATALEPLIGTGNASTWRAIATSHHLAYTNDQLSEVGAP